MKSLLMKLGMVVVTMGIVGWIGWPLQGALQTSGVSSEPQQVGTNVVGGKNQPPVQTALQGKTGAFSTEKQAESHARSVDHLLDLNQANAGELEALPGIGAVLAQRVVAFRQSVGGFRSIEELRAVKGIGAKKFDRLRPLVTVSAMGQKAATEQRTL